MQINENIRGWEDRTPGGEVCLNLRMDLIPGCYYSLASIEKDIVMTPLGQQIIRRQPSPLDGPNK